LANKFTRLDTEADLKLARPNVNHFDANSTQVELFPPQRTALPDQEGPSEGTCNELEMFSTRELAYYITLIDWDLFCSLHEVSDRVDECASPLVG
jgi:hypothetical protein